MARRTTSRSVHRSVTRAAVYLPVQGSTDPTRSSSRVVRRDHDLSSAHALRLYSFPFGDVEFSTRLCNATVHGPDAPETWVLRLLRDRKSRGRKPWSPARARVALGGDDPLGDQGQRPRLRTFAVRGRGRIARRRETGTASSSGNRERHAKRLGARGASKGTPCR